MKNLLNTIRNYYAEIYKFFLFFLSIVLIVILFPLEGKFKYEFQKGKPWMHEDLIAPFDFAILKTEKELNNEKESVLKQLKPYFVVKQSVYDNKYNELVNNFEKAWNEKFPNSKPNDALKKKNAFLCYEIIDSLYNRGIIQIIPDIEKKPSDFDVIVIKNNVAEEKELNQFFSILSADEFIVNELKKQQKIETKLLTNILEKAIEQNVIYDKERTIYEKQSALNNISFTRGMVQLGERIISKGELVTNEKYQVIYSLKTEYESQLGSSSKYYLILIGQIILVLVSITVLALFLASFRKDIFADNKKIILILFQIFIMVLITSLTIRYKVDYLYIVPLCIVPIVIRVFFDTRLALFVHITTIIITGFLVPNSFEFLFLQLIAGIISIISVVSLRKRSHLFLTSFLIFITYSTIYIGISLMQEGSFENINSKNFIWFGSSAMLTLLSYPLIFIFEKIFGLVTDLTLIELSDTNNDLLRELSIKAPGTFQHSLQVANLAEEAIFAIGGNTLLARAGALYHDIGKIEIAVYFIENQKNNVNPHDDLDYDESAKIIISHVINGINLAKKHKVPEAVIDFIRTHHGTTYTKYFYNMYVKNFPDIEADKNLFSYHGPIPFSKETAVIMMADSVEAASRSLKNPTEETINSLVDGIISTQINEMQFLNADITFKDITKIKKIFKKRLMNIYHARVEYPHL